MRTQRITFSKVSRKILLSSISGLLSGIAVSVFLILLNKATILREQNAWLIWLLPAAGLLIGLIYHHYGKDVARGHNLILDEIHDPKQITPLRMTPFVLLGTIVTHLFGGSAGREGTAVQMGASLSDQIGKLTTLSVEERKRLLVAGTGAGFGAAIGAPWAGVIFGMEVLAIGRLRTSAFFECLIASFVAYFTTHILRVPHTIYPSLDTPDVSLFTMTWIFVAGLAFGIAARLFVYLTHFVERLSEKLISYGPLKPFFAGLILIALYAWEGTYRYAGLGIPIIQESLKHVSSFSDPFFKAIFTSITVGSGFKGGEFVPLVFIGATLGSALSILIPLSFQVLAGVGFAALFSGASNSPLASTVMAMELFGFHIAPFALVACFSSYFVSSHRGIYKAQRVRLKKHFVVLGAIRWTKRRLKKINAS